jgi:hypothetical protein
MARIDHYELGRIVVDGRQETRDFIILPGRVVRNWWRHDGHALVLDDLVEVLDELPAHLVVGTGAQRWKAMGGDGRSWGADSHPSS